MLTVIGKDGKIIKFSLWHWDDGTKGFSRSLLGIIQIIIYYAKSVKNIVKFFTFFSLSRRNILYSPTFFMKKITKTLKINEIYKSIQGESTHIGRPCIFVRLTYCNLRCTCYDTEYAFYEGMILLMK